MLNKSPEQSESVSPTYIDSGVKHITIVARPDFSVDGMVSLLKNHQHRYHVTAVEPEVFSASLTKTHCPDVLLVNNNVNPGSMDDYFREIKQACKDTIVLLFGHGMDDNTLYMAMRAGARGYLNDKMRGDHLTTALDTVMDGGYWAERHILCQFISDKSAHDRVDDNVKLLSERLTAREMEVLELILKGMTTNEIAERIFLSHQGVKAHLTNLFRKFNVKNRAQLILTVLNEVSPLQQFSEIVEAGLKSARTRKTGQNRAA